MPKAPPYREEFRRRAVELVRTSGDPPSRVARALGVSETGLRNWLVQAEINAGERQGLSSDERKKVRLPAMIIEPSYLYRATGSHPKRTSLRGSGHPEHRRPNGRHQLRHTLRVTGRRRRAPGRVPLGRAPGQRVHRNGRQMVRQQAEHRTLGTHHPAQDALRCQGSIDCGGGRESNPPPGVVAGVVKCHSMPSEQGRCLWRCPPRAALYRPVSSFP